MHKIGVMMMGTMKESPKKVKQIILQVEGKTRMSNIAEYLLDMGKVVNTNVQFSLEKGGRPVSEASNITQALKYATPVNGVLKLYLYQKGEYLTVSVDKHKQQSSQQQLKKSQVKVVEKVSARKEEEVEVKSSFCCC